MSKKFLSSILFADPTTKLKRDPVYFGFNRSDAIQSGYSWTEDNEFEHTTYSTNLQKAIQKIESWSEKEKFGDEGSKGIDYQEWIYQLETLLYDLPLAFDLITNTKSEYQKLVSENELTSGLDLRLRKLVYESLAKNIKRRLHVESKLNSKLRGEGGIHLASGLFKWARISCRNHYQEESQRLADQINNYDMKSGQLVSSVLDEFLTLSMRTKPSPFMIYVNLMSCLEPVGALNEILPLLKIKIESVKEKKLKEEDLWYFIARLRNSINGHEIRVGSSECRDITQRVIF